MDIKTQLTISINQANSLKQITKMSGWEIIDKHIKKTEKECLFILENINNQNMLDIQSARFLLKWIRDFRDLFRYREISASYDEVELQKINKKERR